MGHVNVRFLIDNQLRWSVSGLIGESWLPPFQWIPSGLNQPMILLLLIVPISLLAWIWVRRSRGVPLPLDYSRHGSGTVTRVMINLAESLAPLLLAVVIWIWAGPVRLGKPVEKRALTNIQLCVDISGSMSSSFGDGSRYDASMKAIDEFLDFREGDACGLTFFGNQVMHWCPLTTDHSAIRCSPPFMSPDRNIPGFGGTSIGKALLSCRKLLMDRQEGDRIIVLISDGASSDLYGGKDVEIAQRCYEQGVVVYCIHIGGNDPPSEIFTITSMTGGEVFNPGDPEALGAVFARIDSMQKAQIEQTVAEQLDHFVPYSAVGLLLLGLVAMCSFGLRYTPW